MIRTHEELDAIINEGVEINNKRGTVTMEEWQFNAIIATARAAIPRPIADAPKDSTELDHIECYIGSAFDHLCGATESTWDQQVSKACERLVCARKLISKYKSQLNQTSQ